MANATLTKEGALQVSDRNVVSNLNSEMLGGTKEDQVLRTDVKRTLTGEITVENGGTINVKENGDLKVGQCHIRSTLTGMAIGF